jgi:hypothetical protein
MDRNMKNIDAMAVIQVHLAKCHVLETWTWSFVLLQARDDRQLPAENHTAAMLLLAEHSPTTKEHTAWVLSPLYTIIYTRNSSGGKAKSKVVPVLNWLSITHWRRVRKCRYSSIILDLGSRWRWVISFTPWPLYPQGKSPRYPLDRWLARPQNRCGRCGVEKRLSFLSGIEPFRPSLVRRYTDWASPAPIQRQVERKLNKLKQKWMGFMPCWIWVSHCGDYDIFGDTALSNRAKVNRRFGGTYRIRFDSEDGGHVSQKCWLNFTWLHGVISQKTEFPST